LIDEDYLQKWGEYQTIIAMRQQLEGHLTDADLLHWHHGNFGMINRRVGRLDSVAQHFTRAIAYAEDVQSPALSQWHCELGNYYADQIDMMRAVEQYDRAIAVARQHRDVAREARAVGNLAIARRQTGRLEEAQLLYNQAIEMDNRLADEYRRATHVGNLGKVFLASGDVDKAVGCFEDAVVSLRKQGSRYGEATFVGHLGEASVTRARVEEAIELFRESTHRLRGMGESRSSSYALEALGGAYQQQSDLVKARDAYEQCRRLNVPETKYRSLVMLGVICLEEGDVVQAHDYLRDAVEACREILAKAPSFYEAAYRLGLAYAAIHQRDAAIAQYRGALSVCDATGVRKDALRDLALLRRASPSLSFGEELASLLAGGAPTPR
jgi:tetratricopeptide (TPR) repeat protein